MIVHRRILQRFHVTTLRRVAKTVSMGKKQTQAQGAAGATVAQTRKTTQHAPQTQQQKQKQPQGAGGLQHYTSFLQVLVLDIDHTSPSVLLFFNKERYLFNAGEGIQRMFREHKLKIKQLDAYLVTRISTETCGGLPGMALAVAPVEAEAMLDQSPVCTVKGPRGLASYAAAFRSYINKEASVAVEEFDGMGAKPVVKTDVVSITPFVISVPQAAASLSPARSGPASASADGGEAAANGNGAAAEASDGEASAGEDGTPAAKRQRTDAGRAESSVEDDDDRQRPSSLAHPDVVVYAIQLAGRPGKFDPNKAKELGVTPGPDFGKLQRGTPITTATGRLVTPNEVMEPAVPGPSLLVLDTPTPESMEAVAADPRVRRFVAEAINDGSAGGTAGTNGADVAFQSSSDRLCMALHLIPRPLASDQPRLDAWRSDLLGPSWRHVLVTPGSKQPSSIPRATVFQAKLNAISPTCFPLFKLDNVEAPPTLPDAELEAARQAVKEAEAAAAEAAAVVRAAKRGKKGAAAAASAGDGAAASPGGDTAVTVEPPSSSKAAPTPAAPEAAAAAPRSDAAAGGGGGPMAAVAHVGPRQLPRLPLPAAGVATDTLSAVRFHLMPTTWQGVDYNDVFQYQSSSKVLEEIRSDPAYADVLSSAADVRRVSEEVEAGTEPVPESTSSSEVVPEAVARRDRRQLELTFLGTASSQPSKYRNVSGCYVDLFDRGGMLVDCGEDAMGQMKRRFGSEDTDRRLGPGLALVWISHMHADHHGGLYRLLEWRARRGLPPLLVIGPQSLFDVLIRYSAAIPIKFFFMANNALSRPSNWRKPPSVVWAAFAAALKRLGLAALAPFPVEHIYDAHGLKLQGQAGWTVVFSGDTRPCEQTITAARGATLLVHEATFEECMEDEARAKKHSTTAEAVSVGERAGAYRTILTHFSTRYPTLPELDLTPHPSVAVAMDLMSVNLADLPWLPSLVRPMGQLFKVLEAEKLADGDADDDD